MEVTVVVSDRVVVTIAVVVFVVSSVLLISDCAVSTVVDDSVV